MDSYTFLMDGRGFGVFGEEEVSILFAGGQKAGANEPFLAVIARECFFDRSNLIVCWEIATLLRSSR